MKSKFRPVLDVVEAYKNDTGKDIHINNDIDAPITAAPNEWVVMTSREIYTLTDRAFKGLFMPLQARFFDVTGG